MNEKKQIEKATAEKFIQEYNRKHNASFEVIELGENPDVRCLDRNNNELNIEITLTEDREGDIKALLGRSDHKSLKYVKLHGMDPASNLSGNVLDKVCQRIQEKMKNDYGANVALVVRDASRVGWDWELNKENITNEIKDVNNPFDKGIWILSLNGEILRVL